MASVNTSQAFERVKLGTEDIATLKVRLILNITSLNGFIQRYEVSIITVEYYVLTL